MEHSPHESLEELLERLLANTSPEDITPAAFVGVISTLEGWKATFRPDDSGENLARRASFLKQWSESARDFFGQLPNTRWSCFFEVGDSNLVGHRLSSLNGGYALYDTLTLSPHSPYMINFADMMDVPQDTFDYDLPDEKHSDRRQLFLGDTVKCVAISFNQFTEALLYQNGSVNLLPKTAQF